MENINDLKKRFEELTKKKSDLESQKIQLTTKQQVLEEEITKFTSQLKEEFGVSSLEEAEAKIADLSKEIEQGLSEAEQKLSSYQV